jgi:hypothetical protein
MKNTSVGYYANHVMRKTIPMGTKKTTIEYI